MVGTSIAALIVVIITLLAGWGGYEVGKKFTKQQTEGRESHEGEILALVFGILGLSLSSYGLFIAVEYWDRNFTTDKQHVTDPTGPKNFDMI